MPLLDRLAVDVKLERPQQAGVNADSAGGIPVACPVALR